jgi:hypothetical protein
MSRSPQEETSMAWQNRTINGTNGEYKIDLKALGFVLPKFWVNYQCRYESFVAGVASFKTAMHDLCDWRAFLAD